jgi:hypothetical protein
MGAMGSKYMGESGKMSLPSARSLATVCMLSLEQQRQYTGGVCSCGGVQVLYLCELEGRAAVVASCTQRLAHCSVCGGENAGAHL